MPIKTLTIDGKLITSRQEESILEAAKEHGFAIPTLCHLEGLTEAAACRMCLVELDPTHRLVLQRLFS